MGHHLTEPRAQHTPAAWRFVASPRRLIEWNSPVEGSHSGLVRAPAKRLPWVTGVEGSNPSPSAISPSESAIRILTQSSQADTLA